MRYNDLVPELGVYDFQRSLDFYTKILEFKIEYSRIKDRFAFLSCEGSQLMIEEVSGIKKATSEEFKNGAWRTGELEYPYGRGLSLSIRVTSIDSTYQRILEVNYPVMLKPQDKWYRRDNILVGESQLLILDPDGYLLRLQEGLGEKNITS